MSFSFLNHPFWVTPFWKHPYKCFYCWWIPEILHKKIPARTPSSFPNCRDRGRRRKWTLSYLSPRRNRDRSTRTQYLAMSNVKLSMTVKSTSGNWEYPKKVNNILVQHPYIGSVYFLLGVQTKILAFRVFNAEWKLYYLCAGIFQPITALAFEHNSTSERYQQKPDLSWHTAFQRSKKGGLADPAANDVHRVVTNVVIVPIDLAERKNGA